MRKLLKASSLIIQLCAVEYVQHIRHSLIVSGLRLPSSYDRVFTFYDAIHKMKTKYLMFCLLSNNLYGFWSKYLQQLHINYNQWLFLFKCIKCWIFSFFFYFNYSRKLLVWTFSKFCFCMWLHFLRYNYVCVNKPVYMPCQVHLVTAPFDKCLWAPV